MVDSELELLEADGKVWALNKQSSEVEYALALPGDISWYFASSVSGYLELLVVISIQVEKQIKYILS